MMTSRDLLIYQRVGNPKGEALLVIPREDFGWDVLFFPWDSYRGYWDSGGEVRIFVFYTNKQTNKQKDSQLDAARESLTIVPHGAPN
jgi:hypothetical protein